MDTGFASASALLDTEGLPLNLFRLLGLVWFGFGAWDANVNYFHVPLPRWLYWDFTLPLAIFVYAAFGVLILVGRIRWSS